MSNPPLTQLERMRIQMEYAVPLIRDLQRLLGTDIVNNALAQRSQPDAANDALPGTVADFGRMQQGAEHFAAGGALQYDVITSDTDHFDMDVSECGYARMMDTLDARDIGHLLICNLDFPAASRIGMQLQRTQTKMQGADHCDFRYSRKS